MSVTNDFVPFCYNDTGSNLEEQAAYLTDPDRENGNQPGVASSQLVNKALRQATYIGGLVAQFVANTTDTNTQDNATPAEFLAQLTAALEFLPPIINTYTSGSSTYSLPYIFFIASGNATSGATYTNNGNTYTVSTTISGGLVLTTTGNGSPNSSGTLTKASGTGDATITFYAVRAPSYLEVEVLGGGGGASGSGESGMGAGGSGGNSSFGTTFLTANGGSGAQLSSAVAGPGGQGGGVSVGAGATALTALAGGWGGAGATGNAVSSVFILPGGMGGVSVKGGAGAGNYYASAGFAAQANSGSGGGGATTANLSAVFYSGGGGGAGGYIKAIVVPSSSTYAVVVGAGGAGGSAGSSGFAGGAGGSGFVSVKAFFQ
jgi:hypothetical protein